MKLVDCLTLLSLIEGMDDEDHAAHELATGHWGQRGAGAVFVCPSTGRVGLGFRGPQSNTPDCWGTCGGAIDRGESYEQGLAREIEEELGYRITNFTKIDQFKTSTFEYVTYLVVCDNEFKPDLSAAPPWEMVKFGWFDPRKMPAPIHPGTKGTLMKPAVMAMIGKALGAQR